MVLNHSKNEKPNGRILAIGDVHGCAKTLESLIDQVMPMHDDVMVFLGDLVDRGDKVFETIEFCIKLKEMFPETVFLMGNHEEMFIHYLKGNGTPDSDGIFRYNGGNATIDSYLENLRILDEIDNPLCWDDLPQSHRNFYDNLKIYHEIDEYVFVHAGVRPKVPLADQLAYDIIWIRDEFLYFSSPVMPGRIIVHGHTPMEREEINKYNEKYNDKYNLDSACVFGLDLTCRDLTNGIVTRVKRRDRRVG